MSQYGGNQFSGQQMQVQDPRLNQVVTELNKFSQFVQQGMGGLTANLRRIEQKVTALEVRNALADAGRKARGEIKFRSQFGEDVVAHTLLGGQLDGFYVEVGAFDGKMFSVSSIFDVMGWKGVLVEANPEKAAACKTNRPNATTVHAALGKKGSSGTASFKVTEDQFGGLLSYLKPDGQHAKAMSNAKITSKAVDVPLTTLDDVLKSHTGEIDLVAIDVAGGEADMLDGFDIAKWKPRLLMIKDNTRGQEKAIDGVMGSLPYTFVGFIEASRIYIRTDDTAMIDRAKFGA